MSHYALQMPCFVDLNFFRSLQTCWTELWFNIQIDLDVVLIHSHCHYIKSLFYSVISVCPQIQSQCYCADPHEIAKVDKINLYVKCAGKTMEVDIFLMERISIVQKGACEWAGKKPEKMSLIFEGKHSIYKLFLRLIWCRPCHLQWFMKCIHMKILSTILKTSLQISNCQHYLFSGQSLDVNKTVYEYGLRGGCTVHLIHA